jgi:anti-sigma regulatory factor (Ser/Thr protein kinase)
MRVTPAACEVATVRRMVRDWLNDVAVAASEADDVVLIVSELVANGVIHAGGFDITVSAWRREGQVFVEVITLSGVTPRSPQATESGDLAEGGRGLAIVARLARDVRLCVDATQWVVTCTIPLPVNPGVAAQ